MEMALGDLPCGAVGLMATLLETVAVWPGLLLAILVYGFLPGFCLRLIVLAYPRGDPRRDELIAELYAVPRVGRPFWVAQQLEVALFEGLGHRVSATIRRLRDRHRKPRRTEVPAQRVDVQGREPPASSPVTFVGVL
jgi:hypothetical protein